MKREIREIWKDMGFIEIFCLAMLVAIIIGAIVGLFDGLFNQ